MSKSSDEDRTDRRGRCRVGIAAPIVATPGHGHRGSEPPSRATDLPLHPPGMVSPDGRYLAQVLADRLTMRDLASGVGRNITDGVSWQKHSLAPQRPRSRSARSAAAARVEIVTTAGLLRARPRSRDGRSSGLVRRRASCASAPRDGHTRRAPRPGGRHDFGKNGLRRRRISDSAVQPSHFSVLAFPDFSCQQQRATGVGMNPTRRGPHRPRLVIARGRPVTNTPALFIQLFECVWLWRLGAFVLRVRWAGLVTRAFGPASRDAPLPDRRAPVYRVAGKFPQPAGKRADGAQAHFSGYVARGRRRGA